MQPDKWPWIFIKSVRLLLVLTILLSFLCVKAIASPLDIERAGDFLQGLLDHPKTMDEFIYDDDLEIAQRLGISYPEASCKPLISWDLPVQVRNRLRKSGLEGHFTIEELDGRHSRLVLFPHDSTATRSWIFREGKVVSSILYRVNDWNQLDSPHFRFFISDTTLFHSANVEALESFLVYMASLLGMSDSDMNLLAKEKIYYCFCRNQEEIHELTGYVARGMYVLSHDIIVSTYSAHFHELAHLLVNFRLKQPHLYTHPFFLEGFAVTTGGRGGRSSEVIHQLGLSLHRAEWISLGEFLDASAFYQMNASISYPGSAPYNRFLLDYLGISKYLALYTQYGGDSQAVSQLRILRTVLPADIEWQHYIAEQPQEGAIGPGAEGLEMTHGPVAFRLLPDTMHYGFAVPEVTLTIEKPTDVQYRSILYEQFFETQPYAGERILIRASSEEIGVYDLYTNTMIAHYTVGLSNNITEVPISNNLYLFHIDRSVFPDDLVDVKCRFIED